MGSNSSETHRIVEKPIIDFAPAHSPMVVREFSDKNKTVIMPQPQHTPDLAAADFFLFLKLKTPMKEKRFL